MTVRSIGSLVVAVLASSILLAGAPGQGTGRANGNPRSSRADRVRVKPLRPAADTDVVLDEILLTQDDTGRSRVIMSGPLEKGVRERLIFIGDPKTDRYRVLRLTTDHRADAKRIQRAYRNFGQDVSDQEIAGLLESDWYRQGERIRGLRDQADGRSGRQAGLRQQGTAAEPGYQVLRVANQSQQPRPMVPSSGPRSTALQRQSSNDCAASDDTAAEGPRVSNVQWVYRCAGYGYADIQTWEPAKRLFNSLNHLNETWTGAWWARANSAIYGLYVDGFCWANPETFANTHWFTSWCMPHGSSYGTGFDSNYSGLYANVDFLYQVFGIPYPVALYVASTASVQYVNGYPNWGAQYYTEGFSYISQFESFLLTAVVTGEAYESGCAWYCEPDGNTLSSCLAGGPTRYWDYDICECADSSASPIVIDLEDDGLKLTDPQGGVSFDLRADGRPVRTAWTRSDSNDAFLALDRNHNGTIDDGAELFGNATPQPAAKGKRSRKSSPNGFLALSVFDDPANGGNADHMISEDDAIYGSLRLWIDANHDGVSQPEELKTLAGAGVRAISLHYVVGKKVDEFGNVYRFRGHVMMDRDVASNGPVGRRAIDVFFRVIPG